MDIERNMGIRFSPNKEELIKLLYILARGGRLPTCIPIENVDVYQDSKTWELMEERKEFYCFMKLKNKTSRSSRINRVTQHGTWKGQSDKKIMSSQNHVGSCRSFTFEAKKDVPVTKRLVMHEFRLDGDLKLLHNGYVIVHIKTYPKKGSNLNRHEDEQVLPQHQHQQELSPLRQIQASQHVQQPELEDQENPLQEFAWANIPLWVGSDSEEPGLHGNGEIMSMDDLEQEGDDQLLAAYRSQTDGSMLTGRRELTGNEHLFRSGER